MNGRRHQRKHDPQFITTQQTHNIEFSWNVVNGMLQIVSNLKHSLFYVSLSTCVLFGMLPETKCNVTGCAETTSHSLRFMKIPYFAFVVLCGDKLWVMFSLVISSIHSDCSFLNIRCVVVIVIRFLSRFPMGLTSEIAMRAQLRFLVAYCLVCLSIECMSI